MKVIPLSEAKSRLSYYGRRCHKEPIIVTVNGTPAFELAPLTEDDDLINQLIEHNPDFRQLLKDRLNDPLISGKEVLKRLTKKQ